MQSLSIRRPVEVSIFVRSLAQGSKDIRSIFQLSNVAAFHEPVWGNTVQGAVTWRVAIDSRHRILGWQGQPIVAFSTFWKDIRKSGYDGIIGGRRISSGKIDRRSQASARKFDELRLYSRPDQLPDFAVIARSVGRPLNISINSRWTIATAQAGSIRGRLTSNAPDSLIFYRRNEIPGFCITRAGKLVTSQEWRPAYRPVDPILAGRLPDTVRMLLSGSELASEVVIRWLRVPWSEEEDVKSALLTPEGFEDLLASTETGGSGVRERYHQGEASWFRAVLGLLYYYSSAQDITSSRALRLSFFATTLLVALFIIQSLVFGFGSWTVVAIAIVQLILVLGLAFPVRRWLKRWDWQNSSSSAALAGEIESVQ